MPHPGPFDRDGTLKTNVAPTMLYGLIAAIPAVQPVLLELVPLALTLGGVGAMKQNKIGEMPAVLFV